MTRRLTTRRPLAQISCGILAGVALACAPAIANANTSNAAAKLATRVATATDRQLVITMRQQITPTYAEITYSDAPKRIAAEFLGSGLASGNIKGRSFSRAGQSCYSSTKAPFVGLTTIGVSLLPQGTAGLSTISYTQPAAHVLQWTIAANSSGGREQGTIWFNKHNLIVKAKNRSYSAGKHGTAQATTVTLSYPKGLPRRVPARVPRACKA